MKIPEFNYVGVGPNNDPEMIEAITGQPALRVGQSAIIANVELCIQTGEEVPSVPLNPGMPSVKDVLTRGWGEHIDFKDFKAYTPRRKRGPTTRGTPFALTPEALDAIWEWELTELGWFMPAQVEAYVWPDDRSMQLWTELIPEDQPVARVVDGRAYSHFLMPKSFSIANAEKARRMANS